MTLYVLLYLVAIVVANLTVAAFGPQVVIVNASALVGLDLTLRDRLHDAWHDDHLALRMCGLIAAGGVISFILNRDAAQIALASTVAFVAASAADALVYRLLERRPRLARVNGSNVVGAAVDSLLFPTIAFGAVLPVIVIGQFAAKVAGGFMWSLILAIPQWRRAS